MKITEVDIREAAEGLSPIVMKRLGNVVLLAGRNGGGKSRVLRTLASHIELHLSATEVESVERKLRENTKHLAQSREREITLESKAQRSQQENDELVRIRQAIQHFQAQVDIYTSKLRRHEALKFEEGSHKAIPVLYQVKDTELIDHTTMRQSEIESASANMESEFNIGFARHYGLGALQRFVNEYVYADSEERAAKEPRMQRLKSLISDLLGAELTWDASGPKLFGLPIGSAQLSEGQKVLLQIALSLFFQDGSREGLVLLLDEPENHLHPQAVLEVVSRITAACPGAQIWIATHSIHLLAHYESSAIWFVDRGMVEYAGENSIKVLHSLLGGEGGIEELADFLALPARLSVAKFAAQCMFPPETVDTAVGDPQARQIFELVRPRLQSGAPLRILDFGAGKGRLLAALVHELRGVDTFADEVDYLAYDHSPSAGDESICKQRLLAAYGSSVGRYLSGPRSLDGVNAQSADIVVMCNVLHEIEPSQWLDIFGPDGVITRIIKPTGVLVIVEDQVLKVGERAHGYGYLVLDSAELRVLFGLDREDSSFHTVDHPDAPYRGRLKAHVIPGGVLSNVTSETRRAAIRQLCASAKAEVKGLQGEQYDRVKARAYAFWAHQFVNAQLAAGEL